jgi:hypothetical protein
MRYSRTVKSLFLPTVMSEPSRRRSSAILAAPRDEAITHADLHADDGNVNWRAGRTTVTSPTSRTTSPYAALRGHHQLRQQQHHRTSTRRTIPS